MCLVWPVDCSCSQGSTDARGCASPCHASGPMHRRIVMLLCLQTLVCGLLGLPPVNGVLPQAPMHTRSLAHISKQHQHQQNGNAAAQHACTIHGSNSSESDWRGGSHDVEGHAQHDGVPYVEAVAESLSQMQLGQPYQHVRSTATYPVGVTGQQQQLQQPEGVHAVTTALSHMHLDTPVDDDPDDNPFGTPRASAAIAPRSQPFHETQETAVVRRRQRSLSPTATAGVTAAASSALQRQQRHQQSLELQQQAHSRTRGRLHPSGSDVAINSLPDSAAVDLGPGDANAADGQLVVDHGSYLRLEV